MANSKRIQLLFVGGYPHPTQPHKNVFNHRAVEQLSASCDVSVITIWMWKPGRKFIEKIVKDNITVYYLAVPMLKLEEGLGAVKLNQFVASWVSSIMGKVVSKADVIHSAMGDFYGFIGTRLSRKFRKPHVAQFIGSDVNTIIPKLIQYKPYRKLTEGMRFATFNSKAMLEEFNKLYPNSNIGKQVIYRGIKLDNFSPVQKNGSEDIQFLFLGGIPAYKGLTHKENTKGGVTLMKAWEKLDAEGQTTHARLVFAGPETENNPLIAQWTKGLKHPEKVILPGTLNPQQVKEFYAASHVVILPSMEEGLPNVAVEASACGLPVIGSRVGGVPEVVEDGKTGFLFTAGDENELSEAILRFIKDRQLAPQLGAQARQRAEQVFNASQFAPAYLEVYQKVIN